MENTELIKRQTREYIKNAIEDAGCIDMGVLVEVINEDLMKKGEKARKKHGFTDDEAIKKTLKTYILGNGMVFAAKYGLEEILKWEHMKV